MSVKLNSTERRKKFEKWISVPMLRACGGLPMLSGLINSVWKDGKEIPCSTCKKIYGSVYKNKDGKWYCSNCSEPIDGLEEYKNRE